MLNKYFNYYDQTGASVADGTLTREQQLYDTMLVESIQIKGLDVKYVEKSTPNLDKLFGEDPQKIYVNAITIEMYLSSFEEFSGVDTFNIIGQDIKDECNLTVAKSRFDTLVGHEPYEGDLIYLPLKNKKSGILFEIRFVEDEDQFYPLANLMHYKLKCSLFEHGQETVQTLDAVIDSVMGDEYPEDRVDITTQQGDNNHIQDLADDIIVRDEVKPFGEF